MFGASNQLIAALALIVGSCYLLGTRRSALVTAIPAVFMLFTTVAALLYNANGFLFPPTAETAPNYILGIGSVVLALLGLYVAIEAVFAVPKLLKKAQELPEPEVAAGGD
jgi:carbon starvation protein